MLLINRINQLKNQLWLFWFLILAVIFIIHVLTLTISPTIWQDEVQIIDYGRTIFHPKTDWSVNWSISLDRPALCLTYLGTALQSLAYDLTRSPFGPRLMSLIGSVIAATCCLGWLLSLGTHKWAAFCLSLAYFLDPLFVSSYRGARVDSWVMSLCFIACWMIRSQINNLQSGKETSRQLFFTIGVLMATSFFIWPTALFLLPLIFLELYELLSYKQKHTKNLLTLRNDLLLLLLGVSIAAAVVIIPVWGQVITAVNDLVNFSRSDSLAANLNHKLNSDLMQLKTSITIDPFLLVGGITSVFFIRKRKLALAVFFVSSIIMFSRPYGNRILYLTPYLILSIGYLYQAQSMKKLKKNKTYLFKNSFLIILIVWAMSLSLGYRTIIALSQIEGRSPRLLEQIVLNSIPAGNHHVLAPYEFYYAGRNLNWQTFTPFIGSYTPEQWQRFIAKIDYVIFPDNIDSTNIKKIENAGLKFNKILSKPIDREQTRFLFGGQPFGKYKLYARTKTIQ